jgi:hypothetical protein
MVAKNEKLIWVKDEGSNDRLKSFLTTEGDQRTIAISLICQATNTYLTCVATLSQHQRQLSSSTVELA